MTTLYIKNMVCDRCRMAVEHALVDLGLTPIAVELGQATVRDDVSAEKREELREALEHIGFELLDDRRKQIIEHIKTSIIRMVHYHDERLQRQNISSMLSSELHQDYSSLSHLFSEVEGKTIERYFIEQRIERVKELIRYDEMSLKQIAMRMDYSSTAHLSNQFKSVTGMTPTEFKMLKGNTRRPIDKI